MELSCDGFSQEDIENLKTSIEENKVCDKVHLRAMSFDDAYAEIINTGLTLVGEVSIGVLAVIIVGALRKIVENKPKIEPKIIVDKSINIFVGDSIEVIQTKLNRIQ